MFEIARDNFWPLIQLQQHQRLQQQLFAFDISDRFGTQNCTYARQMCMNLNVWAAEIVAIANKMFTLFIG